MGFNIRLIFAVSLFLAIQPIEASSCQKDIENLGDPFEVGRVVFTDARAVGEGLRRFLKLEPSYERKDFPQVPVGSKAELFSFRVLPKTMNEWHLAPKVIVFGDMLGWFWLTGHGTIPPNVLMSCQACGMPTDTPVLVELRTGSRVERLDAGLSVSGLLSPMAGVPEKMISIITRDGRFAVQIVEDLSQGGYLVSTTFKTKTLFRVKEETRRFHLKSLSADPLTLSVYQ
jgi:hypothetical protein